MERRSKERVIPIEIYTDGSLKKMGRSMTFGGWSFIILRDNRPVYSFYGSEYNTTSQRMELTAIAQALEAVRTIRRGTERVIIYSDSAYAVNCYLQEWYISWIKNGWVNSKGEPVANQDLWSTIIPYFDNFWYTFSKVRGHAGVKWNEQCDQIAQQAALALKEHFKGEQSYDKQRCV